MRALKTFMRNRKAEMLGCGPCECRTLQCWRYANENCGCGEESGLPNYAKVLANGFGGYEIRFFNDDEEQFNEILLDVDTDVEEVIWRVTVGMFGIIEDEDTNSLWLNMWESLDAEVVMKLFGIDEGKMGVGHFTPEAMAQFNAFINNPTEEQIQILRDWLEDSASDEYYPPRHPIVILNEEPLFPNKFFVASNTEELYSMYFFNGDMEQDNTISVVTDPDSEAGDSRVVVGEFLAIEDEEANRLWRRMWESLDAEAVEKLLGREEGNTGAGRFTPEAMAQFYAFINNPTEDQADFLKGWLEDSASDYYNPPHYPIVTFGGWGPETLLPIVTADLESLSVEDVRRIFSGPEGTPVKINGRTYYFENMEDYDYVMADVHDALSWFNSSISIETDEEWGEERVVLGEIIPNPEWWMGPWEYTSTNN